MNLAVQLGDPITAVTHADPYPYYAQLVAEQPFYHDATLGMWVASSAEAVTAVLSSPLCRVRPPAEPIPKVLLGSPAADIFGQLVRMTDGEHHDRYKQTISATLAPLDTALIAEQSHQWARVLFDELRPDHDMARLSEFAFQMPVYTVASLLGAPEAMLKSAVLWVSDYVRGIAPGSSAEQIAQGKNAAAQLLELFHRLLSTQLTATNKTLLTSLARHPGKSDANAIVANAIGLMVQTHDATAGLIGNPLLLLASRPDVRKQVLEDCGLLNQVVSEVLRYDSPVQNTRRFVAEDGLIAGQNVCAGDTILVILAAANRDPLANPDPERFDIHRKNRRLFTFGLGSHACPGEILATLITRAAVAHLLGRGLNIDNLAASIGYHPSVNARIPVWSVFADG